MSDPTEQDIEHGISLLREAHNDYRWKGKASFVPIDFECRWGYPKQTCGRNLHKVVVLPFEDLQGVHVIAVCDHHADCLEAALKKWREMA